MSAHDEERFERAARLTAADIERVLFPATYDNAQWADTLRARLAETRAWTPAARDRDGSYYAETGTHFIELRPDGILVVGNGRESVHLPAGAAEAVSACLSARGT